jgi:hypothetical protein
LAGFDKSKVYDHFLHISKTFESTIARKKKKKKGKKKKEKKKKKKKQ